MSNICFSLIARYALIYCVILSGALFISHIFKKKTCQTIAPSIMSIMIILYAFGFLGVLKLGVYAIVALYLILGIYTIIKKYKTKTVKDIFDSGFVFFTLAFALFAFTTYNRWFLYCDDYGYWSLAAKNMFHLDDFILNPNSHINAKYPPFPTILHYFFERIIGESKNGIELFANIMFGFSLLLPLLKTVKKGKVFNTIVTYALILAIPSIFCESYFYQSIYVDSLIGILIGYILFENYTSKSKDKFWLFSILESILVLSFIKPSGIVLAVIIIFTMICEYIIKEIMKLEERSFKNIIKIIFNFKQLRKYILITLVAVIMVASWGICKSKNNVTSNSLTNHKSNYEESTIVYLKKVALNCFAGIEDTTPAIDSDSSSIRSLFIHLFENNKYSFVPFGMSGGLWIFLFAITTILLYKFIIKGKDKNDFISFMSAVFIGLFAYICFLQVAYIIEFPQHEGLSHASIERYVGSFFIAMMYCLVGSALSYFNENETSSKTTYAFILALVLFFTPISPITDVTIASGVMNEYIRNDLLGTMIDGSAEVNKNVKEDEKIYAVHQTLTQNEHRVKFLYYIYPLTSEKVIAFSAKEKTAEIDTQVNEWKKELYNEYDYVFILDSDEYFNNNFAEIFYQDKVKPWTLYKVQKDNNDVELVPMEESKK